MAEYTCTNSAKRRQRKQFSPERRQGPEGKKWQSLHRTLPKTAPPQPNEIRTAKSAASGVPAVRAVILHK